MTNCNYTKMSNQEILDELKHIQVYPTKLKIYLQNHCPEFWGEIMRRTSYLKSDESILCRIYCLEHDISEHPICQGEVDGVKCMNKVKWDRKQKGFKKFCSCKCAQGNELTKRRRIDTCMMKYGCRSSAQSSEVKNKISQAMNNMSEDTKYEIRNKILNTCNSRYGGIGFASKQLSDKVKNKVRERFGVDNASQSESIKQKKISTSMIHFDTENPMQSSQVKEKNKSTCIEKYGVENVFQSEEIKEKMKNTCLERYGVEHYSQSYEYHKNKRHKFHSEKYPGLTFDSNWEVKVYEFCKDNHIEVEYSPSISFEYEYDGRIWTYHPDFLINGKLYEVKGDQFFRINESTGKEEMFCPYGRTKFGEEKWKWSCGKSEAKHQCILKNRVTILRESEVFNLSNLKW